jgi:hypothetical protein
MASCLVVAGTARDLVLSPYAPVLPYWKKAVPGPRSGLNATPVSARAVAGSVFAAGVATSYAPMSQARPAGRSTPRASVSGQPALLPASIAGLPCSSAMVATREYATPHGEAAASGGARRVRVGAVAVDDVLAQRQAGVPVRHAAPDRLPHLRSRVSVTDRQAADRDPAFRALGLEHAIPAFAVDERVADERIVGIASSGHAWPRPE